MELTTVLERKIITVATKKIRIDLFDVECDCFWPPYAPRSFWRRNKR